MNHFHGNNFTAYSAGTDPKGVNIHAHIVMEEIGIFLARHRSKSIQEFIDRKFDFDIVVTVCDHARETCPVFPGGKERLHHSFEDPSRVVGENGERLEAFRRSRDEIREWLDETF